MGLVPRMADISQTVIRSFNPNNSNWDPPNYLPASHTTKAETKVSSNCTYAFEKHINALTSIKNKHKREKETWENKEKEFS